MLNCISVENMRRSDAQTIEKYIPSLELMNRAAYGIYLAVQWSGNTAIVVGSGNNGGDGFALACILHQRGLPCSVFTLSQRLSRDSAFYADKAQKLGIPILPFTPECLRGYDIVVDCLLGTGFSGELRDNYRFAIQKINESNAFIVSADINSGMNGDSGEASLAVFSDITVTIGYVKNGLITQNAGKYMKKLVVTDIGIELSYPENQICTAQEWKDLCTIHTLDTQMPSIRIENTTYFRCPKWLQREVIYSPPRL